jgi:hypothetical protein
MDGLNDQKLLKSEESDNDLSPKAPRLRTVIVFVAAFAIIVSWLGTYGVTNALVATDVIKPFPVGADPRGKWMLNAFGAIFASFTTLALLFQWTSWRQMKQIDEMANAEDRFAD